MSSSRQFVVYADSPLAASAACALAEQVKRSWSREMQVTAEGKGRIVVVLYPSDAGALPEGDPIRLELNPTAFGPQVLMACHGVSVQQTDLLVPVMIRALCADWALSEGARVDDLGVVLDRVPLWMVSGLTALVLEQEDTLRPWINRSVTIGFALSAREVLERQVLPTNTVQRDQYRAHAWLLTQGLLQLGGGSPKLRGYLVGAVEGLTPREVLPLVYGEDFADLVSLEKWWALHLVRRAEAIVARRLPLGTTANQLEALLAFNLLGQDEKGFIRQRVAIPLTELWRYHDEPWYGPLLTERLVQIQLLQSQAHPLLESALAHYAEALGWLHGGYINRFRRSLRLADRHRQSALDRGRAIADYLGDVERRHGMSGADGPGEGFYQAIGEIEQLEKNRRNPISDYLDRFDH